MNITKVGIVGGGQMGGGIAEVCAKADVDVIIVELTGRTRRAFTDRYYQEPRQSC